MLSTWLDQAIDTVTRLMPAETYLSWSFNVRGLLAVLSKTDHLPVGEHAIHVTVINPDWEQALAQSSRVRDLHEAPARCHGMPATQYDDCLADSNVAVEFLLPIAPCRDA